MTSPQPNVRAPQNCVGRCATIINVSRRRYEPNSSSGVERELKRWACCSMQAAKRRLRVD